MSGQSWLRSGAHGIALAAALGVVACGDDGSSKQGATRDATLVDAAPTDAATAGRALDGAVPLRSDDGSVSLIHADAGTPSEQTADASADASGSDPCGQALFCERFDDYPDAGSIADKQKLGPWHATVQTGATMALDSVHKVSGSALHVHIDQTATSGGRLFADGTQPIFAGTPTHLYGRMMMYIDPNGTSVHWTFFGANGKAEASSPAAGRSASYILSSLPKKGVNTYSFVYGLSGSDGYHDCSSQSSTSMPSAWACVSFELDSVARKLRMYKDGASSPILSVDDHGNACVAPTAVTSPWYGPAISQLYVGAWSFHAMDAPLDVWIDDLIVDTKPVSCPAP